MRRGVKAYFYYDQAPNVPRYISLGTDYLEAMRRWAELEQGNARAHARRLTTFGAVAQRYQADILPTKAPRTQAGGIDVTVSPAWQHLAVKLALPPTSSTGHV